MDTHPSRRGNLYRLLNEHFDDFRHDGIRADALSAILRALQCRTRALGAEVYISIAGLEQIFYHTCKSRACNSCGYVQTINWQREVFSKLPEIPYAGVILTMPPDLWPIFRLNRRLLRALPALGAGVLSDWAHEKYQAQIPIISVLHTFNPKLEFRPHLHVIAGITGLSFRGDDLITGIVFPVELVRRRWREAVVSFLERTFRKSKDGHGKSEERVLNLIAYQGTLLWKVGVKRKHDKNAVLNYNARYLRRPPIADYRIMDFNSNTVRFRFNDKRDQNRVKELVLPIREFIARLIDHIPDNGVHGVRYYGLLSPRMMRSRFGAFMRLLEQVRRPRVPRLRWASSLRRTFGVDPLLDSHGSTLTWSHRLPPCTQQGLAAP